MAIFLKEKYIYTACFLPLGQLNRLLGPARTSPLPREILTPHVTFAFHPENVYRLLFGKEIQVTVLGYGASEQNEGVKVALSSDNRFLQQAIEQIQTPHITLSLGEGGTPVNTRYLRFHEIAPFTLTGVYGGYRSDGKIITEPR